MATITSLGFNITAKWDGAGLKAAQAQLDNLKRSLSSIDGQNLRITATVEDSDAMTRLQALSDQLNRISATHATATADVNVNSAPLDMLRADLDRVAATHATATADVDAHTSSLTALRADLVALGATHATATADVNVNTTGLAAARASLAAFGATRATARTDVDTSSATANLKSVTSELGSAASKMGSLSTAALALGPGLLTVSAGALAGGTAFAAMGAAGLGAAGILGVAVRAAMDGTSEQSKILVNLLNSVDGAFMSFGNDVTPELFGPISTVLKAIIFDMSKLEPAVAALVPTATDLANAFKHWTDNNLQQWVQWIAKNGVPILDNWITIGKNLGAVFGDMLKAFTPMADTMSDKLAILSARLKGWADGGGFTQFIDKIKANGPQVKEFFTSLGDALGNVSHSMAELGPASLNVTILLLKLVAAMPPPVIQAIVIGIVAWRTAMLAKAAADVIATASTIALGSATIVTGSMIIAMSAAILALVAAVVAVGVGIYYLVQNWSTVWNAIKIAAFAVWDALKVAWAATVQGLTVAWAATSAALVVAWNATWNAMKVAAMAVWTALQIAWSAYINAMTAVWNSVGAALSAAWNATWNAMKVAAQAVWSALQAGWSAFVNALSTAFGAFSSAMKTAWSGLWSALSSAWSSFSSAMKTAWSGIWSALSSAWASFSSAMKTAWSGLWSALSSAWASFSSAMKTAWSGIWSALSSAWASFSSAMKTAWSGLWNALSNAWASFSSAMKTAWRGIWDALSSAFGSFSSAMKTAWSGLWNSVKNTAETVWGAIKSGFKSFAGAVEDTLSGLVSKAKSIWNKIVDVFKTPVNAVIGIWDVVAGAVGLPKISKLADGGEVRGPGTATSDSIPAMLSNGEFVVNAAAVNHYGLDHMYQLNSMHLAGGGLVNGDSTVKNQNPGTIGGVKTNNLGTGVGLLGGQPVAMDTAIAALGIHIPNPVDVIKKAASGAAKAAAGAVSDVVGFAKKNAGTLIGAGGALAPDALKVAKDITGDLVYDFAKPLIDAVVNRIPDPAPPGTPKPAGSVPHAGIKKIADSALGILKDKQKIAVESQAVAGSKSVQAWAPTILQALKMEGLPESWLGKIESMMQQESGGNPNAINRTDINAKNGVPSQGLMQVIPPTFAAYHWPGTSNNILDPLANIAAALNYIKHRYGYPPGSPYASGTNNATPGVHLVGENGPEMVLFGGGETVKNASETSSILGSSSAAAGGPPPNVANGPATSDKQLADSLAAWQNYMAQIQNISDTTWGEVSTTAAANWTDMQSNSDPFVTTMTKKFGDAGAAIQTKWAADLTAGTAATTASFDAQAAAASTFGTEIQKTYTDTAAAIETTWSQSLASSAAATTQYWTDVSGANSSGTEALQTDLINPVSTMLTTQLPAAFNQSITAIGTGWENLKKTVRDPVAAVVDVVFNKGIVAMWNAIAGTFDAPTLDTFTMPAYATGGAVSGPGTGTSDSITARLSHGEHVWTAAEVAAAGGHANVAALRSAALGGDTVRMIGANGRYADGGAVVGAPQGGTSSTQGATLTGDPLKDAANATLGSIKDISNPFITAAGDAGKSAIANLLPGTSAFGTLLNNAVDMMVNTVTGWITANDVLPTIGGANDAAAQAWADAQVGKPYALGGNFGATFDCSQYMSGIARAILGETPAPWFTTFAFDGDTAPTGFERELTAPFMIGITNVGVGHTAGTLNGTNYEATPPAVRSGPSARGYDDPMFQDWYGFRPSIEASVGAVTDQNHLAIIDAAMAAAGVPPPDSVAAWEAGMNTIIIRESNWDPNAINNYDSNAAAGMPSQGLAQVIPPTFAAYHVAGTSNNILDPIANVAAAINYIVHTYGSIGNVQQANPNLPPKGYAHGTWGAQTGWHRVGEDGPEWVKFRGGEQVFPNGVHPNGGGETHVTVENHFHGPVTKDAMQYAEGTFSENLRRAVHAGVGKKR